ncbi:unnamed protein product [Schistocephalus solidus]|uniref:SH2 domain-containing protein n=1 Tax=Schistocephalus solidus TaxID=70667 RepID=A0A183SDZ9_SCHSO|nr:unnamed protein product [Schistocephalus solidus]
MTLLDSRPTAEGTCSLLPISASSPNVPASTQDFQNLSNNNHTSLQSSNFSRNENVCYQNASVASTKTLCGPVASPSALTKQQYLELAAIPSGPLGSGRSRPLVPWTEPSAPVPSPSSMMGESLSTEEEPSGLGKNTDKADGSGLWIKVAHMSTASEPTSTLRTSRRVWTFLPRHRKRKMKFLIKPASHHTTPTELWSRKSHFGSYLSGLRRPLSTKKDEHVEGIASPPSALRHNNTPTSAGEELCDGLSGMVLPAFPEDSSPTSASVYQSFSSNVSNSWPPSPSFSAGAEGTLLPSGHQLESEMISLSASCHLQFPRVVKEIRLFCRHRVNWLTQMRLALML